MSEFEKGMNIFFGLPAELQRIVKQKLLDEFWVAIKTHRPCKLLDDRPFCWAYNGVIILYGYRYRRSAADRERLIKMSGRRYNIEFVPLQKWPEGYRF